MHHFSDSSHKWTWDESDYGCTFVSKYLCILEHHLIITQELLSVIRRTHEMFMVFNFEVRGKRIQRTKTNISINTGQNIMKPLMHGSTMFWKQTLGICRSIHIGPPTHKPLLGLLWRGKSMVSVCCWSLGRGSSKHCFHWQWCWLAPNGLL